MSKKTRKHIRPVSLVMALAIIVTLSGFIVLATNPGGVQAQEDCSAYTPGERALFEATGGVCQDDTSVPPPPPVPSTPVPSTPVPSTPVPAGPGSGGSSVSGGENVEVPPGRPTNLTAEAYADGIPQKEIQLTWDSPTDGGSTRQYRIDISENGGTTWYALESDVRNTRYLHADLLANQTFTYRVFANNQHGISAVSNDDSGTTANSWVPARPGRLTANVGIDPSTPI